MTHSLLYRFPSPREIERFDFEDGNGPVSAHRHPNFAGVLGGWVAETAYVAPTARVGAAARVFGVARVLDKARVSGRARVCGNAVITDRAHVYGDAEVFGRAVVTGEAQVYGCARLFDRAQALEDARVFGSTVLRRTESVDVGAWLEKSEDIRLAHNWTAYRTITAFRLISWRASLVTTTFSSWNELPRVLLDQGFISAMEYLALAAETDSQAPGER